MIGDSGLLVLPKSASVTTDVCLFWSAVVRSRPSKSRCHWTNLVR
jgi:hypothetical protein